MPSAGIIVEPAPISAASPAGRSSNPAALRSCFHSNHNDYLGTKQNLADAVNDRLGLSD